MVTRARAAAGTLALASLPYWLPDAVVALRMRIFTLMNGDEAVAIPGRVVDAAHFEEVYAHPAANGRSRGAALSDLFWYWLSPGPELHQEHLEPGRRYDEVALTTRRLLARPRATVAALARGLHGQGSRRAADRRHADGPAARPRDADLGRVRL